MQITGPRPDSTDVRRASLLSKYGIIQAWKVKLPSLQRHNRSRAVTKI